MLSNLQRRVAVVSAAHKSHAGAVLHATANTRDWKSYEAVAEDISGSLRSLGVDAITMPDGIDLPARLAAADAQLVWLNTGGVQGESPMCHAPAVLEAAGVPYVGHGPLNAALLDDKGLFKLACRGLGIKTAPFIIHSPANGCLDTHSPAFRGAFGSYAGPFIVKPVNGRASQNVEFVERLGDVAAMVAAVAGRTNCLVLVEKYLSGAEYCIAVMGAGPAGAVAFSPVERVLEPDERVFTSMDTKAITSERVRVMDAAAEAAIVNELAALATAVYASLNINSLIRLDIRADEDGQLYVLEANPKPDLKRPCGNALSLVCAGLPHLGLTYEHLIAWLLVERLWQLESQRPCMLAHLMPPGLRAADLVARLPASIQAVLQLQCERDRADVPCDWEGFLAESSDDELCAVVPVERPESVLHSSRAASSCSLQHCCNMLLSCSSMTRLQSRLQSRQQLSFDRPVLQPPGSKCKQQA